MSGKELVKVEPLDLTKIEELLLEIVIEFDLTKIEELLLEIVIEPAPMLMLPADASLSAEEWMQLIAIFSYLDADDHAMLRSMSARELEQQFWNL